MRKFQKIIELLLLIILSFTYSETSAQELNFKSNHIFANDNNPGPENLATGLLGPQTFSCFAETNSNYNGYGIKCYGDWNGSVMLVSFTGGVSPYSFLWSTGSTDQILNYLPAGNYQVTISDANASQCTSSVQLTQPDEIFIVPNITQPGCSTCCDGEISLNVSGGIMPYTFNWDNGSYSSSINNLCEGEVFMTLNDMNNCIATFETYLIAPVIIYGCTDSLAVNYNPVATVDDSSCIYAPNWNYTNTANSHSLLIQDTVPITIVGSQIVAGDYIGVFFDSLGTLACGGYISWTGTTTNITAYGADVGNDGFATGESFKWKIWRASDETVFDLTASYIPIPAMPNPGEFTTNGLSSLTSLLANEYQYIELPVTWYIFSTYIEPFEPNIDSVISGIINNVIIVKDAYGNVFWPQYSVNMIDDIIIGDGYQIKMSAIDTLLVTGLSVQPENIVINIPACWSILGYLRKTPAPISIMLSPIISELILVKNSTGNTYWQQFGINNIGDMIPGQGYQIRMNSTQSYTYPAN
ncbi:MAG: hypothetical protein U9R19_05005 [Bacteroidota bacterium]|nr:hypothetical protein [Bacteroidota bacterium]